MQPIFPFLQATNSIQHPWDEILLETRTFVVVPTVGAIVEGWLLIVTKHCVPCMGCLSAAQFAELQNLKGVLVKRMSEYYGAAKVFEHGPNQPGQKVGCGIDHAHLHIVPYPESLIDNTKLIYPNQLDWIKATDITTTRTFNSARTPYLYVEDSTHECHIADATHAPSQLFRRVIAHRLGIPNEFNWREHPHENNVIRTAAKFREYIANEAELLIARSSFA